VTTIFANLVARSLVSAMTHTPASPPWSPVTTPPMSLDEMSTSAAPALRPISVATAIRQADADFIVRGSDGRATAEGSRAAGRGVPGSPGRFPTPLRRRRHPDNRTQPRPFELQPPARPARLADRR